VQREIWARSEKEFRTELAVANRAHPMPSSLSRPNLSAPTHRSKTNSQPFNHLPPLELSCLSFRNFRHLFSTACSLFRQNTGGGIPPSEGLERLLLTLNRSCISFRMNTCKSALQRTTLTSFRINTYKNRGRGGVQRNEPRYNPAAQFGEEDS
jgi:hypothetical protein